MVNIPLLSETTPTQSISLNPLDKIFNIDIFLWGAGF